MANKSVAFSSPGEPNVTLLAEYKIALNATLKINADFVDPFREVWNEIPCADRDVILKVRGGHPQGPVIEIDKKWNCRDTVMALTGQRGFYEQVLALHDGAVRDITAHELARVFQHANGSMESLGSDEDSGPIIAMVA